MNGKFPEDRQLALHEASDWLVRLQDDSVSDAELEEWGNWMARSPANARAFEDVGALWDASAGVTSEALDAAIRDKQHAGVIAMRAPHRARRWTVAAIAAACGAIAIGLVGLRSQVLASPQVLTTELAQRRHVVLADGSAVELDAASRLTVNFSGSDRELVLERGRAYFTVAHDRSRPFNVKSGGVVSQAVGTQFAVDFRKAGEVLVTVAEGRVKVSEPAAQGVDVVQEVTINERVRFNGKGELQGPQAINAALALAWKGGTVIYQGETLASVIEDLNRYSRIPLRLEDPAKGDLKVTGRWDSASVDSWIDGLAHALNMRVIRGSDAILLAARTAGSPATAPAMNRHNPFVPETAP